MNLATTRISITATILACAALAGCDGAVPGKPVAAGSMSDCVELPEGTYQFAGGLFVPASGIPDDWGRENPRNPANEGQWSDSIEGSLRDEGYDWVSIQTRGMIAFLEGPAPDEETKQAAMEAARSAITDDAQASKDRAVVIDNVALESGGAEPIGAAVASLSGSPSMPACQSAFETVLEGHTLEFSANNEAISQNSFAVADAFTGVALLCDAYAIEVGGHTDARGAESFNQRLSQTRANTVRDYLVEHGVSPSAVRAVGYGESQPIDTSQTTEAYARNRRVVFTLTETSPESGN